MKINKQSWGLTLRMKIRENSERNIGTLFSTSYCTVWLSFMLFVIVYDTSAFLVNKRIKLNKFVCNTTSKEVSIYRVKYFKLYK